MTLFYRSLQMFFQLLQILILIRILMRFINLNPNNGFGKIVYELTDPILLPAKGLLNMLKLNTGMLDFSPIVAMFILNIILRIVYNLGI